MLQGRSKGRESGDRRKKMEPRRSNSAGEPSRDAQGLGADDQETELGTMDGTGPSTIGAGRSMGEQRCDDRSTQSFLYSRLERYDDTRHMTLITEIWSRKDDFLSSQDGSWLCNEEGSDRGSDSTSDSE